MDLKEFNELTSDLELKIDESYNKYMHIHESEIVLKYLIVENKRVIGHVMFDEFNKDDSLLIILDLKFELVKSGYGTRFINVLKDYCIKQKISQIILKRPDDKKTEHLTNTNETITLTKEYRIQMYDSIARKLKLRGFYDPEKNVFIYKLSQNP